ncbi:Glutamyl-tRNA(Gln) amidotransferase subunit A [Halomonas sp. THAF5a]|uniref:amidase n=1 Tax=Halomonas sp. THAF5a TaxID=2587844 RepID=UPI0012AA76F2|nr:amidase family protein [Halomonas sp. THAF5a]QFU01108.1 Glutamyl-tRNA(Gln) amidotransferase subunit A [Halomonas sp. THAF5a]
MIPQDFAIEELTIDDMQALLRSGKLSVRGLTEAYLARVEAIDKAGPGLNAIITVNPRALEEADRLDAEFAASGALSGPLHGVPVVVKDQAETKDMMTTFGSIAQDGYQPRDDATVIKKLKAAGAIILAKTALPDFATSWFGFCSRLGETRNPYVLAHDPGGSSSGTAAAVAANLALVGVGEDTGGSIRLPASFCNLVGVRVTPGLISRDGMSPLVVFQDTAGPMARTVTDAALLLDAMVGYDPKDEYTTAALIAGHKGSYVEATEGATLRGTRLGVVRNAFGADDDPAAAPVNRVMTEALNAAREAGAELVDVEIPDLMEHILETSLYLSHSRYDINRFLASRDNMPIKSLEEIREKKLYDPCLDLLEAIFEGPEHPEDDPEYFKKLAARDAFQRLVVGLVAQHRLDGLVFPCTQVLPPSKQAIREGQHEVLSFPTNTLIASQTWMPSICLPAGFSEEGLPVGMELVVLPYHEPELFRLGYAFEQATHYRRVPSYKEA